MVQQRGSSWYKEADLAYPIRVKFVVPPGGMRMVYSDVTLDEWLQSNLGPGMWNWGPVQSRGCGQTTAYYFRRMEDAERFAAAFPQLQLADGVQMPMDTTPVGRKLGPMHTIGCFPRRD